MGVVSDLVAKGYGGYTGWGENEAAADFAATGGSGKWDPTVAGVSPAIKQTAAAKTPTPVNLQDLPALPPMADLPPMQSLPPMEPLPPIEALPPMLVPEPQTITPPTVAPNTYVGGIDMSQVPSVQAYLEGQFNTEEAALQELIAQMRAQEAPLDIYSRLEQEAGLPELRKAATTLTGEIANLEDALRVIEPDITARTRESLVTEAQRRGIVEAKRKPYMEQLTDVSRSLGRLSNQIGEAQQGISTKTELALRGQEMALRPQELYFQALIDRNARALTGFTEDRQTQLDSLYDKLQRERQLSDQEWELAAKLAMQEWEYKQQMELGAQQYRNQVALSERGFQQTQALDERDYLQQQALAERGFAANQLMSEREFEQQKALTERGYQQQTLRDAQQYQRDLALQAQHYEQQQALADKDYQQLLAMSDKEYEQSKGLLRLKDELGLDEESTTTTPATPGGSIKNDAKAFVAEYGGSSVPAGTTAVGSNYYPYSLAPASYASGTAPYSSPFL